MNPFLIYLFVNASRFRFFYISFCMKMILECVKLQHYVTVLQDTSSI
jgi:hypothetical protein